MIQKYLSVSVSVDALEWTGHWLSDQQRCDILTIAIACEESVQPKVRIIAVESKARSDVDPFELAVDSEPFKSGIPQVTATLDALREILCPNEGSDVVSDLKQAAFIEHLLSEVLSRIYPIPKDDIARFTYVIKQLTRLSRRELSADGELELTGMVVATQRRATVATSSVRKRVSTANNDWSIELIRCGVPLLRAMFEDLGMQAIGGATVGESVSPIATSTSGNPTGSPSASTSGGGAVPRDPAPIVVKASGASESERVLMSKVADETSQRELTESVASLVRQLDAALRLRKAPTEPVDPTMTVVGPTLVSVPVIFHAGHSSRTIENARNDIARELGVPNVSVENDPRAYHLRFLIPRHDREFPPIPRMSAIRCDADKRQYLGVLMGVGVDGTAHRSFVSEWPHLLVAGTTGSGKTTFLKSILKQLDSLPTNDFEIVVVDGKAEFDYIGLVNATRFAARFPEVLLGHENAPTVLEWLVDAEIPRRRQALSKYFVENPDAPRQPRDAFVRALHSNSDFPIRPIVVFVDEFAEIMQASGPAAKDFEGLVQRAVQTGRSALVHLMLATQRPDATVIAGAIKANLPSRVALAVPSHHDSMTILNRPGAEELLGTGDLLYMASAGGLYRLQSYSA